MSLMKKIICFTAGSAMLFCLSLTGKSMTVRAAEETLNAYDQVKVNDILDKGAIVSSNSEISIKKDNYSEGVVLSGKTKELTAAKYSFTDEFDFGNSGAKYFVLQGLAQQRKNMKLSFYIDDQKDSFATISLDKQKLNNHWNMTNNKCVDVSKWHLTGKHKISFTISTTEEDQKLSCMMKSVLFTDSKLPVMDFDVEESKGTISEMNASDNHSVESYGNMTLRIPEDYQSEYSKEKFNTTTYELDYLRGRGNSTWWPDKKPYKMKLKKKADLLGMGKSKHWVLLANYYDYTLLRNKITYWMGEQLGMEYTPQCEFVDVVMNGRYLGSYYLSDQVRVGESSVAIDDLEENDETKAVTTGSAVTGGYLLSAQAYYDQGNQIITTSQGAMFELCSPSFEDKVNEAQLNYITNYMQKVENALYGKDFKDKEGHSYTEYMDLDSAVDYYLMQEFSLNGDGFCSSSTYLYKKRDGKLYWGPLWDFDYVAWGATEVGENETSGFIHRNAFWYDRMLQDKTFTTKLKERWPLFKETMLEASKDGGQIDSYAQKIQESQRANYYVNDISSDYVGFEDDWTERYNNIKELYGQEVADMFKDYMERYYPVTKDTVIVTYNGEVARLKNWICERTEWFDNNIDKLKKELCTIRFYDGNKRYKKVTAIKNEGFGSFTPDEPVKKGYLFAGWYMKKSDNSSKKVLVAGDYTVTKDMTVYAKWTKEKVVKIPKLKNIIFANKDYYTTIDEMLDCSALAIPFGASLDEVKWKSSNKKVATITKGGCVEGVKYGTATITATLKNGKKASYKIHVVPRESLSYAYSFELSSKTKKMKVGSYATLSIKTYPANGLGDYRYASSNPSIVEVRDGVLYAKKAGTVKIAVYSSRIEKLKICTVKVTKKTVKKKVVKKKTTKKTAKKTTKKA